MKMDSENNPKNFDGPSLLDYVLSKIKFWKKSSLNSHDFSIDEGSLGPRGESEVSEKVDELRTGDNVLKLSHEKSRGNLPWSFFIAVILAIVAQILFEPAAERSAIPGVFLYLMAGLALIISLIRKEIPDVIYEDDECGAAINPIRANLLIIGLLFEIIAFFLFSNGQFTFINTLLWVSGLVLIILAFWDKTGKLARFFRNVVRKVKQSNWRINVTHWTLVVFLSIVLIMVFRFADLDQVPGEMISDQAERLLAVNDIALGSRPIFSFRNNGSEVFQYYLTDILLTITSSNVTFFALKSVSVISGLITVIYMYLLGKEIANKWVGLLSAVFFGIAYWPNVLARSGLGSVFVPLFISAMLFYLLKGLRESKRNLFLLAGIAFGLGLISYRVFLIAPLIILLAIGLYCLHEQSKDKRLQAMWGLLIIFLIGVVIYLPLLRVVINNPEAYLFRIFSRLAEWERPYPGNGWAIFAKNLWAGLTMFFWSN
ncbi:MAG: glycosyltransferase family 39 protein, partial [Anaerolineaceae bacterium]|nr:glycosyltransferase family 39 protein [Anaerolineaceae bacterium]